MLNPDCYAIMLMHHGTLCMGKSYDEAFNIAETLEKCCERVIKDNYMRHSWARSYSDDDKRNYFLERRMQVKCLKQSVISAHR